MPLPSIGIHWRVQLRYVQDTCDVGYSISYKLISEIKFHSHTSHTSHDQTRLSSTQQNISFQLGILTNLHLACMLFLMHSSLELIY